MTSPTVFISYSHKDEACKDRLVSHLGVLQHEGLFDLWDDRRIGAGEDWEKEIEEAMANANVAILLVSADFLTSKFIRGTEVPTFLKRRDEEGMRIFPIIVKPCAWKQVEWLSRMNLRPKDGKPLSGGNEHQIDTDLATIAEEVAAIIKRVPEDSSDEGHAPLPPEKISLAKLPSTSSALFGRQKELEALDAAWAAHKTNIVTLVAWGGVGKTALVNAWLNRMRDNHFGGAERVFGWSFYSQGASEDKQVSSDVFVASALKWFGDPEPDEGSPWDKGERLAELIKKQKTLLILDGLEPLQNPPGERGGRIKDPGLKSLLRELANHNPGLFVITTRLEVDDIKDFIGNSAQNIPLDHLSPDAGMELLKHLGVKGTSEELKKASREFGYHALALTLLGSYLNVVYDGDVRKRDRIGRLTDEEEHGGHAKRVMESYEEWFKGKPELNILYIMGVFGRPAEGGAIKALMTKPVINGLTSDFKKLSHKNLQFALNHLRKIELLSNENAFGSDKLDCHPLIREHFGEKLKENNSEAWKEAHSRLYDYYKNQGEEYPDTIEGMVPLYAAVAHGCEAGRHQEALDEVYFPRVLRRDEAFSIHKLGAFGADLAALSGFFDETWSKPAAELTEADKGFILNTAGFVLRSLGRLAEAAQPMKASLDGAIAQEDWKNAAIRARNLSDFSLITGDLNHALEYSRQSVDLEDRSGDAYQRIANRTALADALHQAGRLSEAEAAFQEAEEMLSMGELKYEFPTESILFGIWGFRYHNLLLSIGEYQEVLKRENQIKDFHWNRSLLDIALDHLSLGKSHLLQALQEETDDFTQAAEHLNQAVDGLRQAGQQGDLPRGLLARSELSRVQGAFEKAQRDLDEAMTIAERGEMELHQADCHLEYARLYLAMGEKEEDARRNLDTAKEMIGEMGYHRRDTDVREIEEKL
jgi:tetratricopeptide (TPR) repeat protein